MDENKLKRYKRYIHIYTHTYVHRCVHTYLFKKCFNEKYHGIWEMSKLIPYDYRFNFIINNFILLYLTKYFLAIFWGMRISKLDYG